MHLKQEYSKILNKHLLGKNYGEQFTKIVIVMLYLKEIYMMDTTKETCLDKIK